MKYLKIFAFLLAAVSVASCSDDDERNWNKAGDVTVNMSASELSFFENRGVVKVPFTISGETDGYVSVTAEVAEYGENPAMADVHYYLTTETILVEPGEKNGNFEFALANDKDINDARQFVVTIKSVTGAEIGPDMSTVVTIKDDDSNPYYKMAGEWTLSYNDGASKPVELVAIDEGELGYNRFYYMTGLLEDAIVKVNYSYDASSESYHFEIPLGQTVIENFEYESGSTAPLLLYGLDGNYIVDSGSVAMDSNEEQTEMVFDEPVSLALIYYNEGYWATNIYYDCVKLSR